MRCAYLRDDESLEISSSVARRREAIKDMMLLLNSLGKINKPSNADDAINCATEPLLKEHKEEINAIMRNFTDDILPYNDDVLNILKDYQDALDKKDVETFGLEQRTLDLEAIDVVFGTCIGVGVSPYLRDLHFDTLIIDEAGKANYAETLVPMMMADEYILVGDDCQLPPYTNTELVKELARKRCADLSRTSDNDDDDQTYLKSKIDEIMGDVGKSLFGDLKPRLPEPNITMLSKQFRMHPEIGDFVSKLFYGGKVESMVKPEERRLNISGLENPIMFIDTSKMGKEAREQRQGMSLYNDGEIQAIEDRLLDILESALNANRTIGILSPYGAQVERLKQRFPKLSKHIFTIDSIQGEEYDIVVFSFVRNTHTGSLNFVDDLRRLNVSFSRAKCNLIMVGHLETLRNDKLHVIDHEAVMEVYREIESQKVEYVVLSGAMEQLFYDYPPETYPIVCDLDSPYYIFEDCRSMHGGQFSCLYNGKRLSLYNPVLTNVKNGDLPETFRAYFIGYVDGKPHTMIEPIAYWLSKGGCKLREFDFSGMVQSVSKNELILKMCDESIISLSVPQATRFEQGINVIVSVLYSKNTYKFTVKKIKNE